VDEFLEGFIRLARRWAVPLAGGDISAASAITADIVVTGQAPSGKVVLRSGARPGDRIYVSGTLGGSATILKRLYQGRRVPPSRFGRHFYPEPRLKTGLELGRHGLASSMIDLSDGLSVDLAHICEESGVRSRIRADLLPVAKGADLTSALHGGEDYELLFTARGKAKVPQRIGGVPIIEIGTILAPGAGRPAVEIVDEDGRVRALERRGWSHFSRKRG
jgi:thiamine-monophosphate kinase